MGMATGTWKLYRHAFKWSLVHQPTAMKSVYTILLEHVTIHTQWLRTKEYSYLLFLLLLLSTSHGPNSQNAIACTNQKITTGSGSTANGDMRNTKCGKANACARQAISSERNPQAPVAVLPVNVTQLNIAIPCQTEVHVLYPVTAWISPLDVSRSWLIGSFSVCRKTHSTGELSECQLTRSTLLQPRIRDGCGAVNSWLGVWPYVRTICSTALLRTGSFIPAMSIPEYVWKQPTQTHQHEWNKRRLVYIKLCVTPAKILYELGFTGNSSPMTHTFILSKFA